MDEAWTITRGRGSGEVRRNGVVVARITMTPGHMFRWELVDHPEATDTVSLRETAAKAAREAWKARNR